MFIANPSANPLRQAVGRSWWLILLFGILSVLFGVMAMVSPVQAGIGLTWAMGLLALSEGVVGLIAAFRNNLAISRGWMMFYAAISLLFGLMAVINPASMAASIVMVMAAWLLAAGVMRIVFAIRVRKEIDNEWMLILGGVLAVVLGGLLLAMPIAGLVAGVVWIGVGALVYGLLQIVAALRLRKLTP